MNKYFCILLVVVLASCSSKDKRTSSDGAPSASETSAETVKEKKTVEAQAENDPVRPQVAVSSSQYATLNDAIKSESDERIYKEATQILAQAPQDVKAVNALAMYHYKKGRFDLTEYLLRKALSVKQDTSELHSNLGVVLLAKKEQRQAIHSFKRAIQINANDAVANANIGSLYVKDRDYTKAAIALDTAYKKGIRDPKTLNNFAIALAATGKYDRAQDLYKAVLASDPNHKEALFNYATLLIENLNKNSEGLEVLNRLKFVGGLEDSRNKINTLENKAKAGIK